MKPLFFLYVWLNLTRIAELRKENLVKHIRKRTIQTDRLFFSSSLKMKLRCNFRWRYIKVDTENSANFLTKKDDGAGILLCGCFLVFNLSLT